MAESGARLSSRYEMGQTTRSEWESDMRAHRELLRNVIEEHREGRDGAMGWGEMIDELAYEEESVYPPTSALGSANPPSPVTGLCLLTASPGKNRQPLRGRATPLPTAVTPAAIS